MLKQLQVNMAKSESVVDAFDAEDVLSATMGEIGEQQSLPNGRWLLQYIAGQIVSGRNDKGPWTKVILKFRPVEPLEVDEDELLALSLDDLPLVEHVKWVKRKSDQRDLRDLLRLMGDFEDETQLKTAISAAKGGHVSAYVTLGEPYQGKMQYRFANFKTAA